MGKEDQDSERVSAVQLVVGKKGEKEKRNYDFFLTAISRFYGKIFICRFCFSKK